MFSVNRAFSVKRHVSIDLHGGLPVKTAKEIVISKLKYLAQMKIDEVTIITGYGSGDHVNADGSRGAIFSAFPSWIRSREIKPLIKSCVRNIGSYSIHLNVELSLDPDEQEIHDIFSSPLFLSSSKELLESRVREGDLEAQAHLGIMMLQTAASTDVASIKEGIRLIKLAAQNGIQIAQLFIANAHCTGQYNRQGIRKDPKKCVKMYERVIAGESKSHIREAHFLLGTAFILGVGAIQDDTQGINHLTIAANQEHKLAQYSLADLYEYGIRVDKNSDISNKFYIKAAEQGVIDAQIKLAEKYEAGDGIARDPKKAFYWRLKAAIGEHAESQFIVGELYDQGKVVKQDHEIAYKWYLKAAKQGHEESKLRVAYASLFGLPCAVSEKALGWQWLQESVAAKNANAIYLMSVQYKNGNEFVARDDVMAVQLLKEAAELGCIAARKFIYKYEVTDIDPKTIFSWIVESAHNGDAEAQYILAQAFEGKTQYEKAIFWYTEAAEQDFIPAQYKLYTLYLEGAFVQEDEAMAIKWIKRSADLGDAEAQNIVGCCFSKGLNGFEEDDTKAYPWFLKAANQNHTKAQINLAELIMQGPEAFELKKEQATVWMQKAVDLGDSEAKFMFINPEGFLIMHHEIGVAKRAESSSTLPLFSSAQTTVKTSEVSTLVAASADSSFTGLRKGFLL